MIFCGFWSVAVNVVYISQFLLARLLIGQYCFARCRLSASSVGVCDTAGVLAGRPAAVRVGGRAADTARQASTVTSR